MEWRTYLHNYAIRVERCYSYSYVGYYDNSIYLFVLSTEKKYLRLWEINEQSNT